MTCAVMRQYFKIRMWPWMTFWEIGFSDFLLEKLITKQSYKDSTEIVHQVLHWSYINTDDSKFKRLLYLYCNSIKPSNYNLYFWSMQHLTKHMYTVKGKVRWYRRFVIFTAVKVYRNFCLMGDFSHSRYPPLSENVKLWFRASFHFVLFFCARVCVQLGLTLWTCSVDTVRAML